MRSAAALLGFALTGCAANPSPPATTVAPVASTDPYVGTTRWTVGKERRICDRVEDYQTPRPTCFTYEGPLTVVREVTGKYGVSEGYELRTKDGRVGYLSHVYSLESEEAHRKRIADKADCDRRGGVRVGMTRDEVYATCWGKPQKINKTIGSYGVHEQLVYGSQYLYLENGVLRSIQTSE